MNDQLDWRVGALIIIVAFAVMFLVGSWDAEISQAYRDSRNCEFAGVCRP